VSLCATFTRLFRSCVIHVRATREQGSKGVDKIRSEKQEEQLPHVQSLLRESTWLFDSYRTAMQYRRDEKDRGLQRMSSQILPVVLEIEIDASEYTHARTHTHTHTNVWRRNMIYRAIRRQAIPTTANSEGTAAYYRPNYYPQRGQEERRASSKHGSGRFRCCGRREFAGAARGVIMALWAENVHETR